MLNEIDGVVCVEPEGAFYAFPSVKGLLGRRCGGSGRRPAPSWPSCASTRPRWRWCPGEAFGAPGYFRMSYALGDDDLVEGVSRLAELLRRSARLSASTHVERGSEETTAVARVLVTEKIAQSGLDLLAAGRPRGRRAGGPEPRGAARRRRRGARPHHPLVHPGDRRGAGGRHRPPVVGRAGVGLDNVDVAAATARGVMVVNAPTSNILSVAEQAMALLLAQARNIPQAHAALVAGRWERSKWEGVELHGKVLGVVGLGRAGSLVAQRALAFGMQLIAFDPYVSPERARAMGVGCVTIEELVAEADFVSIHTPKTPETIGLFGRDLLAKAKPGIRIINTARGGIVDEEALAEAIRDGIVAGAGLDVFAKEPSTESPLFALPQVVGHPPPRRLDRGGPGQGRGDHRRAGPAGPGRGLRALRRQRGGHRRLRGGAAVHAPGRAAGPLLRLPARRPARPPRDRVPGRAGRGRAPGSSPSRSSRASSPARPRSRCPTSTPRSWPSERGLEVRETSTATSHDYKSPDHPALGVALRRRAR